MTNRERFIEFLRRRTDNLHEVGLIYAGLVLLGAAGLHLTEGVRFYDAVYWAVTTSTSVGFGDITPKTDAGKAVAMAVEIMGVVVMAMLITTLVTVLRPNRHEFTEAEQAEVLEYVRYKREAGQ